MSKIIDIRPADDSHQVVSVVGGGSLYRRQPCPTCPWRLDAQVGAFPAEAFRLSAHTANDMAEEAFACHETGAGKPAACAGFLMSGAAHNFHVRLQKSKGNMLDVTDGGHPLYKNYRAMAIANGVDPDDVALEKCRD